MTLNFRQFTHDLLIAAAQRCHLSLQQFNLPLQIKQALDPALSTHWLDGLPGPISHPLRIDLHALTQIQNRLACFVILEQRRVQTAERTETNQKNGG